MKLCYRGIEYDYNPPSLEVTESEILGKYRGRTTRFSYVRHIPFPQPVAHLKYRGVTYQTNAQGGIQPTPPVANSVGQAAAVLNPSANTPVAAARRHLLREAARAHKENIQRTLQHRLAVAKAQGNETLIRQLEEEMHQFA